MTSESEGYDLEEEEEEEEEDEEMYVEEDMSDADDFEPPKLGGRSAKTAVRQCSLQTALDTSGASSATTANHSKSEAEDTWTSQSSAASTSSSKAKAKGLKLKKRKTKPTVEDAVEKPASTKKVSPQAPITQQYAPSQTPDTCSSANTKSTCNTEVKKSEGSAKSASKTPGGMTETENLSATANTFKLPKLDLHSKKVFEYLKGCNRPFGNTDIARKFAKDLTRAQVNRAVETLLAKDIICTNASQKIVWVSQEVFGQVDPKMLQVITENMAETKRAIADLEQEVQELKAKNKRLASTPANSELAGHIQKLRDTIQASKKELEASQEDGDRCSDKPVSALIDELVFYKKTWKERKHVVEDLVLDMLEAGPKSQTKKSIFSNVGMDSDEAAQVSLKSIQIPKK